MVVVMIVMKILIIIIVKKMFSINKVFITIRTNTVLRIRQNAVSDTSSTFGSPHGIIVFRVLLQ